MAYPDLLVAADLTTPPLTIPTDWTDLSSRVRSASISQGRERLLARTEVGQCSVVMDNRDGGLNSYQPSVHLRIQAVYSGKTYDLFRGFVESWGRQWPGGGFDAVSQVEAEDAFSLMARYELEGQSVGALATGAHLEAVLTAFGWPLAGSIPAGSTWWRLGTVGASELGTSTRLGESLRDFDAGTSTIMALTLEGNLLDHLLNAAETTEQGTFYVGPSGDLIFKQRPSAFDPSAGTWGDAEGELRYTDISMRYDRSEIYNDVRITRRGDTTEATSKDQMSSDQHGPRTLSLSDTLYSTQAQATAAAVDYLQRYRQPVLYPTRLVMRPKPDSALWDVVLGAELGTRITVRRRPPGGGAMIEVDSLIVGVGYSIDQFWEITWRLAPAEPVLQGKWYLGHAGSSELGTTTILA